MTDIRALMAQERQARRLNHEFASYSKSGVLMCTACQLSIKSETLWEGHLRSANHKANTKKVHLASRPMTKRKIEDIEQVQDSQESDARKKLKPKSRTPSEILREPVRDTNATESERERGDEKSVVALPEPEKAQVSPEVANATVGTVTTTPTAPHDKTEVVVDEDEWAAFERDVAPLTQHDYTAATITAAPVSAAQIQAEAESDRKKLRDTEAEDEKEDEGRRIEEEFEVMEEMEERVRKLKEKREALRLLGHSDLDTGQMNPDQHEEASVPVQDLESTNDDSDDDVDDWYS